MRSHRGLVASALALAALLPGLGAGATVPSDAMLFNGVAELGEHGTCTDAGTGSVSGRGVYAPGFTPPDRDASSTMLLSTQVFSASRGVGILNLCMHLTSSPAPSPVLYMPTLSIPEVLDLLELLGDPDPERLVTWRGKATCLDSKGYGGRGLIQTTGLSKALATIQVTDLGWKVASTNKMIVLGRWQSGADQGQLSGVFMFQGGAACFEPEMGARYFTSAGSFTLHQGTSLTWDDVVQPVQPKHAPNQQFWGDKTRS